MPPLDLVRLDVSVFLRHLPCWYRWLMSWSLSYHLLINIPNEMLNNWITFLIFWKYSSGYECIQYASWITK